LSNYSTDGNINFYQFKIEFMSFWGL